MDMGGGISEKDIQGSETKSGKRSKLSEKDLGNVVEKKEQEKKT